MLWEWWQRYRRLLMTSGAVLFLAGSIWLYTAEHKETHDEWPLSPVIVHGKESSDSEALAVASPKPGDKESGNAAVDDESAAPQPIYVDVKGQVEHPGMYTLEAGMRVADAISKAGGTLPAADLDQINLAQPLTDGVAIVIPSKSASPDEQASSHPLPGMLPPLAADAAGVAGANASQTDRRVNLNTATAEELMTLPGIGQAKAQAILAYRTDKKSFRSPEEIKQISGIGEKMYERLKDQIRIQ